MGPCLHLSSWLSALEIEATKEGLREPRSSSRLWINRQTWTSKQFEVIETPSIQKLWRRRGMKLGRWLCGHEDTARPKRINSWYCSWLKFCADSYFVTFFAGLRSLTMFYLIWSGAWFQHILTNKYRDGFSCLARCYGTGASHGWVFGVQKMSWKDPGLAFTVLWFRWSRRPTKVMDSISVQYF